MEGFYKLNEENKTFIFAPNRVASKTFILNKEEKDTYIYPVEGWVWLDSTPEGYTTEAEFLATQNK